MIFVTGGSGFIGTRVVQKLARDRREPVTALVHRLGTVGAARLATFANVRMVHGDVRDRAALDDAMRGARAVVHCAVDVRSALSEREAVTAEGTRAVLDAARRHAVRHIVFLSTAAVHSWRPEGEWNEDAPLRAADYYSKSKLDAEAVLLAQQDVPVTIVRPTCVYGPFSRTWTVTPVEFLRLGIPLVAAGNAGRANLIYVDNLVDLILAALDRPAPAHRVYLANEQEPTGWEALYSAYASTIGLPLAHFAAGESRWNVLQEELSVSWANGRLLAGRVASDVKGPLLRGLKLVHRHVPLAQRCDRFVPAAVLRKMAAGAHAVNGNGAAAAAGSGTNPIRPFAPRELREFYTTRGWFSPARAEGELGWTPRIAADEAIARTCAWIRDANL